MPYMRLCRFAVKKAAFILLLLINLLAMSAASHAADFAVTSPWVGAIASFIGGDKVHVRYLSVWNDKGMVASVGRPRSSEIVIALDADDAARFRIGRKSKNLRLLYEKLPMTGEQLRGVLGAELPEFRAAAKNLWIEGLIQGLLSDGCCSAPCGTMCVSAMKIDRVWQLSKKGRLRLKVAVSCNKSVRLPFLVRLRLLLWAAAYGSPGQGKADKGTEPARQHAAHKGKHRSLIHDEGYI